MLEEILSNNFYKTLMMYLKINNHLALLERQQMGKEGALSQNKAFAQTIDGLNLDGVVGKTTEEVRDFSNELSGANKASQKLLALGKA